MRLLEEFCCDIIWIAKIPALRDLKNSKLLEYAREKNAILVTCDKDFLRLREPQVKILYMKFEITKKISLDSATRETFRGTLRLALEKLLSSEGIYVVKIIDIDRVEY